MGLFDCLSHINIASYTLGLKVRFANNLCRSFFLSSLLTRQISPTFSLYSKSTFSGDSTQRIPKWRTHFLWNFGSLRTGLERRSGIKGTVYLERTQVHFRASSLQLCEQFQLPVTPATGTLMPSSGFPGWTSTYVTHSTLSQTHT